MSSRDELSDEELLEWFEGVIAEAALRYPGSPRTVSYGDEPEQVIDLWGDAEAPAAVVSIHGGYFAAEYDRSVNEPLVRRLVHEGFLVGNVEYRRTGSASDPMHTVEDVRIAVERMVEEAGDRPVIVTGHSAGGYLCLAASAVDGVSAVVPLSPATDLRRLAVEGWDEGEIARWIGSHHDLEPAQWDRVGLETVGVRDIPSVVIHGEADSVVPFSHSEAFASRFAGTRLVGLPGIGHYEFLDPGSEAVDRVVAALQEFAGRAAH